MSGLSFLRMLALSRRRSCGPDRGYGPEAPALVNVTLGRTFSVVVPMVICTRASPAVEGACNVRCHIAPDCWTGPVHEPAPVDSIVTVLELFIAVVSTVTIAVC